MFFAGAAGAAKSLALLMGALQFVDRPGYAALILRKDYKQLALPGALIAVAHEWLDPTDAVWSEKHHRWTFPSGATLTFGHLTDARALEGYKSAAFQYVAIDEVTDFTEPEFMFLFSRLRRPEGSTIPLRYRAASNPGGKGHTAVKRRWVDPTTRAEGSVFLPATIHDNPYLDKDAYIENLRQLHPLLWQRLLHGDWNIAGVGELFQPRVWLDGKTLDVMPDNVTKVRYWDLAATEPSPSNIDPDWTAGALVAYQASEDRYIIGHVTRFRLTGGGVQGRLRQQAEIDKVETAIWIEEERGGSGKSLVDVHKTDTLLGYRVTGDKVTGDKVTRATPFASYMEAGKVFYVPGEWTNACFDELEAFPSGAHDDQVDALAGAFNAVRTSASAGTSYGLLAGQRR